MRLTATPALPAVLPTQRTATEPPGAAPTLARDLLDAAGKVLAGTGDIDDTRATAAALGVLHAHQGHAVGALLDEVTALRTVLRQGRSRRVDATQLVDDLLAAASTGYVEELTAMLQTRATRDPLTGLPNRAAFTEVLTHEIAGADRRTPPALLLIDLDGFKAVNDTDGHLAGDAVLVAVADVIRTTARRSDIACRLGGDEFAVVLPRTTQRQALHAARRLLGAARDATGLSSAHARVTFSVGLGWLPDPASVEELVAVADAALYRAKADGGDAVETSRPADRPART